MKITVDASKQQFIQLARCNGKSILSKKILDAWLISKETGKPIEVEFKFDTIKIWFYEVKTMEEFKRVLFRVKDFLGWLTLAVLLWLLIIGGKITITL